MSWWSMCWQIRRLGECSFRTPKPCLWWRRLLWSSLYPILQKHTQQFATSINNHLGAKGSFIKMKRHPSKFQKMNMQLLKVSTKILLVSNHNFKRIYLKVCVVYVFEIFLQTVNTFSTHFGLFDPTKFFKKLLRKPNLFTIQVFDKVKCFLCSTKQKPSRKKTKMKQEKKSKSIKKCKRMKFGLWFYKISSIQICWTILQFASLVTK